MYRRQSFTTIATMVSGACLAAGLTLLAQDITLPNQKDSLKFAVIGDSGAGSQSQYRVAEKLTASRAKFPYEFVLMMGDNLYTGNKEKDSSSQQ